MRSKSELLEEVLESAEARMDLVEDHLDATIALAIKVLRLQRGWTQQELANRAGIQQQQIALYERCDHESWTGTTLKKIAAGFNLPLTVSFMSWSEFIDYYRAFSGNGLKRAALEEEFPDGL